MRRLLDGFMCLVFHLTVVMYFNINVYFVGTPEYMQSGNLLYRLFYQFVAMTGQRFMYYVGFCFSDAAIIACGLAYSGTVNGVHIYEKVVCIYIYALETTASTAEILKLWNHQVH